MIIRTALVLLLMGAVACGPSHDQQVLQAPIIRVVFLVHGVSNPVLFGSDMPDLVDQDQALTLIDALVGSDYPGWKFYLHRDKCIVPPGYSTGLPTDGHATSFTDFSRSQVHLSFGHNPDGSLWLKDLDYELQNIRCGCESARAG